MGVGSTCVSSGMGTGSTSTGSDGSGGGVGSGVGSGAADGAGVSATVGRTLASGVGVASVSGVGTFSTPGPQPCVHPASRNSTATRGINRFMGLRPLSSSQFICPILPLPCPFHNYS